LKSFKDIVEAKSQIGKMDKIVQTSAKQLAKIQADLIKTAIMITKSPEIDLDDIKFEAKKFKTESDHLIQRLQVELAKFTEEIRRWEQFK
jgi:hypothetical protein